ncbi:MAG: dihydroorotate dehydrogenase [Phycisphaerae bacterium]
MAGPGSILSTTVAGIALRNPVVLAAGTCGYVDELADVIDLTRVGAVVTKSITASPREGNPTWRIIETRAGMMNAIGLANVGIEAFVRDYAPKVAAAARRGVTVIGSIAGYSIEEYVTVAAAMNAIDGMLAVELNVSCPNVHGGCEFGADPAALRELVSAVRAALPARKLFIKLSPIAVGKVGIVEVARAAVESGADALCLCNTMPAMAIDVHTRKPRLANRTGGLSGPAVHPVVVKIVNDVYRQVCKPASVPIVGIGGVLSWEDAAELVLAGASAVEMGTGLFVDPRSPLAVVRGLEKWVRDQGATSITHLVGQVGEAP